MPSSHRPPAVLSLALVALFGGCDALLGGRPQADQILDAYIEGLSSAQLRTFFSGDDAFGDLFTPERGLGPVFNAASCEGCHTGEGKSHPARNLTRFGRGDEFDASKFDYLGELGGPQLQDHAIPGYTAAVLPKGVVTSVRSGPIVVGLGLIEAVPDEALLALADPDDRDGDGVSGRPNYVPVPDFLVTPPGCACAGCKLTAQGCKRIGRFGRKSTAIDILHQAVSAYHNDMGLTTTELSVDVYNPLLGGPSGDDVPDPEVQTSTVQSVVFYLHTLRPPQRRDAEGAQVRRGERVFGEAGCAACHVPAL